MRSVNIDENYILYEDGRVYSVRNKIFLKQSLTKGYFIFGSKLGSVHRLLAHHFLGGIPEGMVVNHKDGNKTNNDLTNLEIVTPAQNMQHAYATGLAKGKPGEDNSMAKLSEDLSLALADDLKSGLDNETIGNKYNLHSRYVSLIRHGKRWKELYENHGPFPKSSKPDPMQAKYELFLTMQDMLNNTEIAKRINVDISTVSRWRSGESRNK